MTNQPASDRHPARYRRWVIRVLLADDLADDEAMVRAGVRAILTAAPDIEVAARCAPAHLGL